MDLLKAFASSFRSVNRMGDTSSSQALPEPDKSETVSKPWSPSDASESSDEEDTIAVQPSFLPSEPEPPPRSTRKAQKNRKQARKRASVSTDTSNTRATDQDGSGPESESDVGHKATQEQAQQVEVADSIKNDTAPENGVADPQTDMDGAEDSAISALRSESDDLQHQPKYAAVKSKSLQVRPKTAQKSHACPVANAYDCDKTFASENAAQRHAHTHSRRLLHQCPFCSKNFTRASNLEKHKLKHTNEQTQERIGTVASQEQSEVEDAEGLEIDMEAAVGDDYSQAELTSRLSTLRKLQDNVLTTNAPERIAETAEQSSGQRTASSASVFSEPVATDVVEETPRPKSRLKRKREVISSSQPTDLGGGKPHKRRRRHSLSPPTSIASDVEQDNERVELNENPSDTIPTLRQKIAKAKTPKHGNLDNFAKPWTPGSQLHHPIHNPRSPRAAPSQFVQILVPQTSRAGPSTTKATNQVRRSSSTQPSNSIDNEQTPLERKLKRANYTSLKGKQRAENGMTYSSPPNRKTSVDETEPLERSGMATTIARRGTPTLAGSKRAREEQDGSENDLLDREDEAHTKHNTQGSNVPFTCPTCNKEFKTKDALQKHEKRPNVHSDRGNGRDYEARKGNFSPGEVRKMERWRDHFCDEYDISVPTFNQMMTDSSRRVKGFEWPYRFIPKADFLKEYYDVLPDRDRRSMHRYKERAFQNIPEKQTWTEEDDQELLQLVQELGQKWVEIGQRMTRTQDSVNQRWRFKVQHNGKTYQGEWTQSEEERLKQIVGEVKQELGLSLDPRADVRIPWSSVSKMMKGTRTAQQCSNKWRLMYQTRKGNVFTKPSDTNDDVQNTPATVTPSKMTQRLAGQTPSTSKPGSSSRKKFVSEARVQESDEEESQADQQNQLDKLSDSGSKADENSIPRNRNELFEDTTLQKSQARPGPEVSSAETPAFSRKALASQTPQTGERLSQIFAQTQANTSALRSPNTARKAHTQTEMPTPGIPIQHRRNSSSWQAINTDDVRTDVSEVETGSEDELEAIKDNDEIMTQPELSDEETQSVENSVEQEASEASEASESTDEEDASEDEEADPASSTRSVSSSPSTDNSRSEDNSMVKDIQKDLFVQSLRPIGSQPVLSSPSSRVSGRRGNQRQPGHWQRLIVEGKSLSYDGSESESGDEGDINHHD